MTHSLAASVQPVSLPAGARAGTLAKDVPGLPNDVLYTVWRASGSELARLAASLGLRPGEADDALQDVYLSALRAGDKRPAEEGELRRWLFRVTINRCRLEHRRRGSWRRLVSSFWRWGRKDDHVADAAQGCQLDEERAAVRQALAMLEEDLKTPLVLRYNCGLDSREIGRILELPDSTVRGRLRTARQRLAAALRAAGFEP